MVIADFPTRDGRQYGLGVSLPTYSVAVKMVGGTDARSISADEG